MNDHPASAVEPASARLRTAFDHWRGLAPCGGLPAYRDFDVVDLPRAILPHVILLDVLEHGTDFRYRVVGTGVVDAIGRDFTGQTVLEYGHGHEPPGVVEGYRAVVATAAPHLYTGTLAPVGKGFIRYERLALPLAGDAGAVDYILACFQFGSALD